MTKLKAKCPNCANIMQFDESNGDKRKRCLRCRRMFKVPEPQTMTEALKVVENAQVGLFVDEQGNTYA